LLKILTIFFLLLTSLYSFKAGFSQDYYNIKSSKAKKVAFVNTLLPKIKKAEKQILSDRKFVENFFQNHIFTYSLKSRSDLTRLIKISKKYRIRHLYNESEYLQKIDTIPVSLVLAQSAIESAWGSSRFAKEGNNLFGEWTWGKIGIIPSGRDENATHKLRIFNNLDDSIKGYMLNLNRHKAYKDFRQLRSHNRKLKKQFTGIEAATTMTNYSQIGEKYNKIIKSVIKKNGFHGYEVKKQ